MVRRSINIKRFENSTTRQVRMWKKRCHGMAKKTRDLSVLSDAEVGSEIFSSKGKLFQFNSGTERATQFMESPKSSQSNLNCDDLERCSLRDLIHLEQQFHNSLGQTRAKKEELFLKLLEDIKEKASERYSLTSGTERVTQFIERSKSLRSNLTGDDLEHPSLRDLIHLEQQIHNSLGQSRAKKEELFLKLQKDINEEVNEVQRKANVNADILEKLVNFGPHIGGSHDLSGEDDAESACSYQALPTDASLSLLAEATELTSGGLRSRNAANLNKSPAATE